MYCTDVFLVSSFGCIKQKICTLSGGPAFIYPSAEPAGEPEAEGAAGSRRGGAGRGCGRRCCRGDGSARHGGGRAARRWVGTGRGAAQRGAAAEAAGGGWMPGPAAVGGGATPPSLPLRRRLPGASAGLGGFGSRAPGTRCGRSARRAERPQPVAGPLPLMGARGSPKWRPQVSSGRRCSSRAAAAAAGEGRWCRGCSVPRAQGLPAPGGGCGPPHGVPVHRCAAAPGKPVRRTARQPNPKEITSFTRLVTASP